MKPYWVVAVAAFSVFLASCGRSANIIAGSKNFTEQAVLGEIAAQQIERTLHVPVERKLYIGGTMLAHLALEHGDIDFYPEYTGTALATVLKQPLETDPRAVFERVSSLYQRRFQLTWLPPIGFNDSFAMVVRNADARALQKQALSSAAVRPWRLGIGYEFLTRPDGMRRFNSFYHLPWKDLPRTMDLGLLYRALDEGQIDMGAANTTDGLLASGRYAVLADDRHAFPPYQACFVIRNAALKAHPGLDGALRNLSGKLSDDAMRNLNRRVDIDHVSVARVAADFLDSVHKPGRP